MKNGKLLIISHNCLSKTGSNGRTLGNCLQGWESENLAQFYIHPEIPDFSICKNFFCISDGDIIRSALKRKPAGKKIENIESKNHSDTISAKSKVLRKNSIVFLLRELAWNSPFWIKSDLFSWIKKFKPDAILFQAGDAGFLFRLCVKISKKYNIPIIMYNTEGYYFKDMSFLSENKFTNLFYPLLHKYFKKEYRKLMEHTVLSVYLCDKLMIDYKKEFNHNAEVVMNSSEFTDIEITKEKPNHHIVYAGNVEVGRYESIIELAEAANSIDNTLFVDLYANVRDPEILNKLESCKAVNIKGFVSYSELQEILKKSEYLLSVENFNPFYCDDSKYAFSTKIPDSLSSGSCFIVYAPETVAISEYLKDKNASVLITSKQDLMPKLQKVLEDVDYRKVLSTNARKLALENHSLQKNKDKFQKLIKDAIKNEDSTG